MKLYQPPVKLKGGKRFSVRLKLKPNSAGLNSWFGQRRTIEITSFVNCPIRECKDRSPVYL